jgi:hypothetical protein
MGASHLTEELPMLEEKIKEAIVIELTRQAEKQPDTIRVSASETRLNVDGDIDLDALAMAIVGSVAGGP